MTDPLTVERDGTVATVMINRPEVHNALNAAVLTGLGEALRELARDGRTRAVLLTGAGRKAFSAGADLDELARLGPVDAHRFLSEGQRVLRAVADSELPVIAAVNGLALGGGCELALACTFAVAAEGAAFGLPEANLGLMPGYGGTQRLPRAVGRATAAYLMLTGDRLPARRAYELGLLAVPPAADDELGGVSRELADRVAGRSPASVRAILAALRLGADAPLGTGLALESALAGLAVGNPDAVEGVAAFREKRAPSFGDQR
ncbi:enoyl-CoA hydratase/isomerase family protein [Pseudonocardia acaciae]|uniref:enoyl-CoA hydratase/isomerase family protein n=1 Tax=Pseudonocardia acaciae TaxID=551276 RepID=UPI00048DD953|nr:enoyl-CoA hydratase-related protein [Pseudonocardia acaciae]